MADLDDALAWWRRSAVAEPRADAPRRVVVAVFDEDVDPAELAAHVREARSALDG
jgi:hypothetical protein